MAEFSRSDLVQGRNAAFERLRREEFPISEGSLDTALDLVVEVLGPWPAELHPRFVRLFAENVAVAAAARATYQEGALTLDEARAFLAVDSWFKNSWKHA
jgi:hypothetical protein